MGGLLCNGKGESAEITNAVRSQPLVSPADQRQECNVQTSSFLPVLSNFRQHQHAICPMVCANALWDEISTGKNCRSFQMSEKELLFPAHTSH